MFIFNSFFSLRKNKKISICQPTQITCIKRYMLNNAAKATTKSVTVIAENTAIKYIRETLCGTTCL